MYGAARALVMSEMIFMSEEIPECREKICGNFSSTFWVYIVSTTYTLEEEMESYESSLPGGYVLYRIASHRVKSIYAACVYASLHIYEVKLDI